MSTTRDTTSPVEMLPDFLLADQGPASAAARAAGLRTFREAAAHTWRLPYGRNSDRADPLLVLSEGRGTCSTKHAFLAMLAREHGADVVRLTLGIYLMSEGNTPGVGAALGAHGLAAVPEAHCYLTTEAGRVDLTHPPSARKGAPIDGFVHEETIDPSQVGTYKAERHRRFIAEWVASGAGPAGLSPEAAWAAREACIAALEGRPDQVR